MSAIEPTMTVEQDGTNVRVTQDWSGVLDKMARDIADRIDEATLARLGYVKRGTCHDKGSRFNAWVCSECEATVLLMFDDYDEPSYSVDGVADVPKFCPNCGAKVVVE